MKTAKDILTDCFLGVIDFNEDAALGAMNKYAKLYHKRKVKRCSLLLNEILKEKMSAEMRTWLMELQKLISK